MAKGLERRTDYEMEFTQMKKRYITQILAADFYIQVERYDFRTHSFVSRWYYLERHVARGKATVKAGQRKHFQFIANVLLPTRFS